MIGSLRERLFSRGGLGAIFVAFAPLVYFFPVVCGWISLAPDDGIIFNLPLRVAAAQMLREGHLPLWNPYIFSGMPLFASAQAGVLFPLNWTFLLFGPATAMNLTVLGTYAFAGLGAFFYACRTGASVPGGMVTALVWQASGFFIAQIGHTNVIQVAAVLPWLLWSIDGYGTTGRRDRGLLVATFVALQVLAGHPQTLLYSLILAGSYAIVLGLAQKNRTQRRAYLFSPALILGGLALAAVQILPTLELLRHSVRNETSYEFFTSFSLPPVFLLTYFAPYVVGGGDGSLFRAPYTGEAFYGEYIGYVGLLSIILALLAPLLMRDRRTIFWAGAGLLCLCLALGRHLPFDFYRLIYHIPVVNLFRVPARHLMEVDFALAVLAGRAVTFIPRMQQDRSRLWLATGAAALVFALTIAAVTIWRPEAIAGFLRAPELFVPIAIGAASVWALLRFARARRWSTALLIIFLVIDLSLWGQFSGWRTGSPPPDHAVFRESSVANFLRAREGSAPGKYRVLTSAQSLASIATGGSGDGGSSVFDIAWQPDTYMMHRIENAVGYDGFGFARYSRLAGELKVWGAFPYPAQTLLVSSVPNLLNIRYLISPASAGEGSEQPPGVDSRTSVARWREVEKFGDVVLHENLQALPRSWLVSEARALPDEEILEVIRTGHFSDGSTWDPRRSVLVDRAFPSLQWSTGENGTSEIVKYEVTAIDVATKGTEPAMLVLSENDYPGWVVTVDGRRTQSIRANYNLRGVLLDPGEHLVRFRFRPRSVYGGFVVSVLTAAVLAVWWAWGRRKRAGQN